MRISDSLQRLERLERLQRLQRLEKDWPFSRTLNLEDQWSLQMILLPSLPHTCIPAGLAEAHEHRQYGEA